MRFFDCSPSRFIATAIIAIVGLSMPRAARADDAADIKNCLGSFWVALLTGDAKGAKSLIIPFEGSDEAIERASRLTKSFDTLLVALKTRYGVVQTFSDPLWVARLLASPQDPDAQPDAEPKISLTGNNATVTFPTAAVTQLPPDKLRLDGAIKLTKVAGVWKLQVQPADAEHFLLVCQGMSKLASFFDRSATDVGAGKFKTAQEAEKFVSDKVSAAMKQFYAGQKPGGGGTNSSPAAGPADLKEKSLYRLVKSEQRQTLLGIGPAMVNPNRPNLLLTMIDPAGRQVALVALEPAGAGPVAASLQSMKPGDYASVETESKNNLAVVKQFAPYQAFDGEYEPGVFAFVENATQTQGKDTLMAVRLYKLGRLADVRVAAVRSAGAAGATPDPKLADAIGQLTKGDAVEVDVTPGSVLILKSISRFYAPVSGTVVSVTDADVDGGKTVALDVQIEGTSRRFLVPGVKNAKGVFTVNSALSRKVKALHQNDRVVVKFSPDGADDYVRDIARAAR